MKIAKTILVIALVITAIPLIGQELSTQLVKTGFNKYMYQNKIYSKYDLIDVFVDYPDLTTSYLKERKSQKIARNLGYLTLGVLGVSWGLLEYESANYCPMICNDDELAFIGILIVAPTIGITATVIHINSKYALNKVINKFNRAQIDKYGRKIEQPRLGFSSKGFGVSISF